MKIIDNIQASTSTLVPNFFENQQTTNTLLMISPDTFQFNIQTADTNAFQMNSVEINQYQEKAKQEFENMVSLLRENHIRVITLNSRKNVITPDAVFPNNWFSIHAVKKNEVIMVLYPMLAESRRAERQVDAIKLALQAQSIQITQIIDLTQFEKQQKFLEGTGSMVLDRINKIAYAALSPRTHIEVLNQFANHMGYQPLAFHSYDKNIKSIYHTNVMMSVGTHVAVINAESIKDQSERDIVLKTLAKTKKEMILITHEQMHKMAGNILEVRDINGNPKIIMSNTAYQAFTATQREQLEQYGKFVVVTIPVIEKIGGGSARCMLAEVF